MVAPRVCRDELNLVGIPVYFNNVSGQIENPPGTTNQFHVISENKVVSNSKQQLMEEAERAREGDNWFERIIPTRNNQVIGGKYNKILNDEINNCAAQDSGRFCSLFQ